MSHQAVDDMVVMSDLAHVASLTNQELFTEVIASIKKGCGSNNNEHHNWQPIAIKVAIATAKGESGYCCADDWVKQYTNLSNNSSNDQTNYGEPGATNFRQALTSLPEGECYKNRMINALNSLEAYSGADNLSIKQIAGLIRCSSSLAADDGDADAKDQICSLQSRAISQLVHLMPQLAKTNPCDIFLAIQLPLLQKLEYNAFVKGGMNLRFGEDLDGTFRAYLNTKFTDKDCDSQEHKIGLKRKRELDVIIADSYSKDTTSSDIISHIVEAAHLARKEKVRAQHGAVIYIAQEGGETKVIGRGWNHDFLLDQSKSKKNKIVLHSEVHAVVDAIHHYGEDECFNKLFPQATIMIVELHSDYAYDTCHPCPKCDPTLRAVGITKVLHTTPHGKIEKLDLGSANYGLLANDVVSIPLSAACDERKISCKRLQEAIVENEK